MSSALNFEELKLIGTQDEFSRFRLIPLVAFGVTALIIIDHSQKEWGYINANRTSHGEAFQHTRLALSHFEEYEPKIIELTNYFHRDYELLHLMTAMVFLDRAFNYAVMLPQKLIYQECDFRKISHELCLRQQVINQSHNLQNNLIQANGILSAGALIAYPSPIHYEQSVVKVDQCIFCKRIFKRGLGVHMKMAHGGQAQLNRELRRRKEESSQASSYSQQT